MSRQITRKKILFCAMMGGMTIIASRACRWQHFRYYQSLRKEERMLQQENNFQPCSIDLHDELPWVKDYKEWEFLIVEIEGREFVMRARNGRMGYAIIAPFELKDKRGIMVNIGWIPQELYEDFSKKSVFEIAGKLYNREFSNENKTKIYGFIRKSEKDPFATKESNYLSWLHPQKPKENIEANQPDLKNLTEKAGFSSIDCINMLKKYNFDNLTESNYYLETILEKDDPKQDIYPACYNIKNFQRGYLTPSKHLGYCTFWGSCTTIGIITILKVLFY